jgi:CrcB protein
MLEFLLVGIGGFMGSVARYGVAIVLRTASTSSGFPLGTLVVNILGCFIIAVVATLAEKTTLISPEARLLLATGFCGGFTTYSSLMYEVMALLEDSAILYASLYIGTTAIGGFLAFYLGTVLVHKLL